MEDLDLDFAFAMPEMAGRYGKIGRPVRLFEAYLEWEEGSDDAKALREAAHTTSDFATYLTAAIRKRFFTAYAAAPANWRQYVRTVDMPDFKPDTLVGLGEFSDLEQVGEEDQYTYGTIGQLTGPTLVLHTWGRLMGIHRKVFINDDLGRIRSIPQAMARAAARTLATDVMNVLLLNPNTYDGHPLFDAVNHGNLGSATLDETSLQAAITAIRKQTNQNGVRADFKPRDLIVPVDLEFTARRLLQSGTILPASGGGGTLNIMQGILNLVVENKLTDPNDWYVQATIEGDDPAAIVVGFLNGVEAPSLLQRTTVQNMGGGAFDPYNLEVDSVDWKVRHDWGVTPGEWRVIYASKPA